VCAAEQSGQQLHNSHHKHKAAQAAEQTQHPTCQTLTTANLQRAEGMLLLGVAKNAEQHIKGKTEHRRSHSVTNWLTIKPFLTTMIS
jgi:hypothetical protein